MKYKTHVIVNRPLKKVIELMSDANNLKEWQPGLVSFETFEGKQGEVGAKSKLVIKAGGRDMEMIETITKKDFSSQPYEYNGQYVTTGMINNVRNLFSEVDENSTKYESESEMVPTNFMMKVTNFVMPGMFKKMCKETSDGLLENFKKFAESRD